MKMMDAEAMKAGVELRRYTAKPTSAKEFYTELPFEMELDGPYYSMLSFFDRVGKLERIVNVPGPSVATTKKPTDAKAKHTYQYAPNESVVATYTATTFFKSRHGTARERACPARSARAGGKVEESYEAYDWNSFAGGGKRNCPGAEPERHRQHQEHDEGGRAKETN